MYVLLVGLRAIIRETTVLVCESLILTAWYFAIPLENDMDNKLRGTIDLNPTFLASSISGRISRCGRDRGRREWRGRLAIRAGLSAVGM